MIARSKQRACIVAALLLVVAGSGCGHDRPSAAARVPVPLIPSELPPGYVLSRVDERPADGGGRWIDLSFAPQVDDRDDPTDVISLHQFLDVEPDLTFLADGGERMQVRGRPAVCGDDGILRWLETRTALMSVGGGDLPCADLRAIAESMTETDAETWRQYRAGGRDR